ncbi:hypothetical protein [Nocardia sp. CY41]|uniref:hypothetical protein n=1 Tax=Nocardia sp. CY41 TaxID=2608686 RepID=UPI00135C746D|nr:hypothetical protein [Nocardia sp. CY41]
MTFPTPYEVGLHVYSETARDGHGNPVAVYTPPLDEPGTPYAVIGWAITGTDEPALDGHDREITSVELLTPPGFPAVARDVIDLPADPAGQFEIVGAVKTSGPANPFGWNPGGVLNLERVEG